MSPMFASAALFLLATLPAAQSGSGRVFQRVSKPLRSATLDLATGTVTVGPRASNRAGTTVVDFDNIDLGGFVGVDSGGGFCEWFDAGQKGWIPGQGSPQPFQNSGNLSELMNSVVFAYCSSALDVSSGGPGGAVKLGFYEGYVTGGGTPTTAVALLTLTGLPANTASGTFPSFSCYFLRIVLGSLVPFADGPIGYSWKFLDTGVAFPPSPLAATFPFLSCVASCSGGVSGLPDGQGMDDLIDQYCPPGTLRSTFSFGTTSGTSTSISMIIEEAAPVTATVTGFNSSTFPNPDVLTGTAAVVGQPWSAALMLGLGRTKSSSWALFFGTSLVAPPAGVPISQFLGMALNFGSAKGGRMLLCSINTSGFSCPGVHTGVLGSTSSTNCGGGAIPLSLGLVANAWCAQAVVLGPVTGNGNARLSSAIAGLMGTN